MTRIQKIVRRLKQYKPLKVVLFGSAARGQTDEHSDLDFVVIKSTRKTFLARMVEIARLLGRKAGKVDVFVYTPREFRRMIEWESPFIENVLREGKVVYEEK